MFNIKTLVAGQEIEMAGWVCLTPYNTFIFGQHIPTDYIKIVEHTIKVIVPDNFNVVAEAVKSVDAEINKLKDEHHKNLNVLINKKNELLQISYGGAVILDAEGDSNVPS